MDGEGKPKAVIVGGSIAGVSTALALSEAGWDVVVLEKTTAPSTGSPTGAGLGLDSLSLAIIRSWLSQPHLLHDSTVPLTIDQVSLCKFQLLLCLNSFLLIQIIASSILLPSVSIMIEDYLKVT